MLGVHTHALLMGCGSGEDFLEELLLMGRLGALLVDLDVGLHGAPDFLRADLDHPLHAA